MKLCTNTFIAFLCGLGIFQLCACNENPNKENAGVPDTPAEDGLGPRIGPMVVHVAGAVFSRDGKSLLLCYRVDRVHGRRLEGNRAVLFDVTTGKMVWETTIPNWSRPVGFLADDRYFVLHDPSDLQVPDKDRRTPGLEIRDKDGKLVRRFSPRMDVSRGGVFYSGGVSIAADGKSIFTFNVDGLTQWDPTNLKVLRELPAPYSWWLFYSRRGHTLDETERGAVRCFDIETLAAEQPKRWGRNFFDLSHDGKLASTSGNGCELVLWDIPQKQVARTIATGELHGGGFSADDKRFVGANEERLAVWNLGTGRQLWSTQEGKVSDSWGFALSRDSRFAFTAHGWHPVSSGVRISLKLWDVEKHALQHTLLDYPNTVEVNPDLPP